MKKVSFIGSGNVATHLAIGFKKAGVTISEIYSPTKSHADRLALKVGAKPISNLADLNTEAVDVIIISISDDAIEALANSLTSSTTIVVHTSGTKGLAKLNKHAQRGVFYPLQTFSKDKTVSFRNIPFCLDASNAETLLILKELAGLLSSDVRITNEETRKSIHVAAVVASNFANHMFALAEGLLESTGEDLSILTPLIQETVAKALTNHPKAVQTGPAVREDTKVINSHLARLTDDKELQKLYQDISNSIIKLKNE